MMIWLNDEIRYDEMRYDEICGSGMYRGAGWFEATKKEHLPCRRIVSFSCRR
jgi:hypothetical protein